MSPFLPINPPSAGSACSICFGTDKPFGNAATPDYMSATIADIILGTTWIEDDGLVANGSYKLTQLSPCVWQFLGGDVIVTLVWSLGGTAVTVERNAILQFESLNSAACTIFGNNNFADSARNFSRGNFQLFL